MILLRRLPTVGHGLWLAAVVVVAVGLTACGGGGDAADEADPVRDTSPAAAPTSAGDVDGVPRVVDVVATPDGDGSYRFDVTISSPYETPDKYADAWRVVDEDGTEFGLRVLVHDHADEQPFTRSLDGVAIPDGVTVVFVEARDLVDGWSGERFEVDLAEG